MKASRGYVEISHSVAQLPDRAAREISPDDFKVYEVIRVADEIGVDLMVKASGIDYNAATAGIVEVEIEGVRIAFARTKRVSISAACDVKEGSVADNGSRKARAAVLYIVLFSKNVTAPR